MGSKKSGGAIFGSERLGDASDSVPGRAIKGAGSFLFGPSIFLAGVICGAVGKIAAESTNALLSSWVKSVSSGVSTLFANNPFLTWASSASGDLMGKSADSFFYFYQESLVAIGSQLAEASNHDGFGNTGRADESNVDPRDAEARMARTKDGRNVATEKRLKEDSAAFFEMLKEFNQPENASAAQEAIRAMEEWAKGAKALEAEVAGKTATEQTAAMKKYADDFEKAVEQNKALGALTDILDRAAKMAVVGIQEDLANNRPVEPADFAKAYKKLADAATPDTVVEHPTGNEVRGVGPRVASAV
jgi:hypothetical protein